MFGKTVSELQSNVAVADGKITGTLEFIEGGLAETGPLSGDGNFLALKFSNPDPRATSIKVGLDPSADSGLVELLGDPDMNGVFKIGSTSQVFKVVTTVGGSTDTQTYNLEELVLEDANSVG